jgi:hypothetical protein
VSIPEQPDRQINVIPEQLAAAMLLQLDIIVLGILPAVAIIIALAYLIGLNYSEPVIDLAIWYSPWYIFTGYFCTPLGYLGGLIPPVLTTLVARKVWTGEKHSWVLLLIVITMHSAIAIVGLMYHAFLATANNAGTLADTYSMYIQTRAIFAGVIIILNLLTIIFFRLWKHK